MGSVYDKPVRLLMKDFVDDLGLEAGRVFSREEVQTWFERHYPKIKKGTIGAHLVRMSVNAPSRVHYSPKPDEDDLFFQLDSRRFRLYEPGRDPAPIGTDPDARDPEVEEEEATAQASPEFAYEKDLQNYLARNLELLEPGLKLFEDEGVNGVEFPVGGRFIDLLAVDRNGDLVVIELKVSRGYDRVVGQLLRYRAWIKRNHAEKGQKVRGIIIARQISEDLKLACADVPDLALFEYQLSVSLQSVDT